MVYLNVNHVVHLYCCMCFCVNILPLYTLSFFLYLKVSQFKLIFLFNSFCFVLFLLERIFVSAAGGEGEGEGIHVCLTLLCVMLEKSNKQIKKKKKD